AQERAGRAPVRAAGVLGATRGTNVGPDREAARHAGRLGRASGAGRVGAASSSTTETSGKSARAKLSCARASSGASTPSRSTLGARRRPAHGARPRLSGNPPPGPPPPGPRSDIVPTTPAAPRRALGHALIFFLALARRARLEALEPVEPPIEDLHRRAAEPAA